jgi:hypothetical protein
MVRCLCLAIAFVFPTAARTQGPTSFVGDWKLVSLVQPDSTGGQHDQWGPNPIGIIHYGANGLMAAQLYDERRKPLGAANFQDVSPADARAAFVGLATYFGSYVVDTTAKTVTHTVQGAMAPDWIGRKLVRGYRFLAPNRIELRVITGLDGKPTKWGQVLVWERLGSR